MLPDQFTASFQSLITYNNFSMNKRQTNSQPSRSIKFGISDAENFLNDSIAEAEVHLKMHGNS